jgi:hypothetical protein
MEEIDEITIRQAARKDSKGCMIIMLVLSGKSFSGPSMETMMRQGKSFKIPL